MTHNKTDSERINLLPSRNGLEGAIRFAKQCVVVYRRATLDAKRRYGRYNAYRSLYIRSYLFHKHFLEITSCH